LPFILISIAELGLFEYLLNELKLVSQNSNKNNNKLKSDFFLTFIERKHKWEKQKCHKENLLLH